MRQLTIFILTILLLAFFSSFAWSGGPIDITKPKKVAALNDISKKLDSISTAVTNCMSSGKVHGDCMCDNEELILNFNRAVEELFKTYADLKAMDVVNFKNPNGRGIGLSLSGIKKQAQMKLSCN